MNAKVVIIGDSLIKDIPKEGKRYQTVCFRGLTIERFQDKLIRGVFDQHISTNSTVVLLLGTNNLASQSAEKISSGILNSASILKSRFRGIKVKVCSIVPRADKIYLNDKCKQTNKLLKETCGKQELDLIPIHTAFLYKHRIKRHLLDYHGLHLTKSGSLAVQRSILAKV